MWTILHAIDPSQHRKKKLRPKEENIISHPEKSFMYISVLWAERKITHASNSSKVHPPHKPSTRFYLFLPRFDIPEEKKKDHRLRLYPKIKPLALHSIHQNRNLHPKNRVHPPPAYSLYSPNIIPFIPLQIPFFQTSS